MGINMGKIRDTTVRKLIKMTLAKDKMTSRQVEKEMMKEGMTPSDKMNINQNVWVTLLEFLILMKLVEKKEI